MSRPFDWSVLGWGSDPTPGDPVVLRAGGWHYQEVSVKMGRAETTLQAMRAGATSGSKSVEALLMNSVELAQQLGVAKTRYKTAGDALDPGHDLASLGGGQVRSRGR